MTYPVKSIGDLTDILSGYAFDSSYFDKGHGVNLIRIRDVVRGFSQTKYSGEYEQKYLIKRGDLLIGMDGEFNIARWQSNDALLNQRVCKISVSNQQLLDENYLYHFLPAQLKKIEDATPFVTVKHLSVKSLNQIQIPLPPLAEQKRIAAILDKAAEIKAKREQAIAKLDELTQSIFVEMFGDPIINPKNLRKQKLTEFFKFKTGKLDSNAAIKDGKYPFFTCSRENFLIDEFAFDEEALLLAGNNASGDYSVKHYSGKFNAYQRTYVINLESPDCTYEYAKTGLEFMLAKLKRLSKGTNTKYLTMGMFNDMTILVPPKESQQQYGKVIKKLEKIKAQNVRGLEGLRNLTSSIEHHAFATGFN